MEDRMTSREAADGVPALEGAGRARALTVLSPFPRRWLWLVRLAFAIKRRQGPDPTLQRLSFIHVAHWVLLAHFPGERRPNLYAYILFVSNFNGSWREYIDAFAQAIPGRMTRLWGASYGFPGARPPRPFVNYIERNQLPAAHYYSAYPQASATEVASALRVRRRFHDEVLPATGLDDDGFASAWLSFVETVQRDL
jgi:hypothetical protein